VSLSTGPEPRGVGPPSSLGSPSAAPSLCCHLLTSPGRTEQRPEPSVPSCSVAPRVTVASCCDISTAGLRAPQVRAGTPWGAATRSERAAASQGWVGSAEAGARALSTPVARAGAPAASAEPRARSPGAAVEGGPVGRKVLLRPCDPRGPPWPREVSAPAPGTGSAASRSGKGILPLCAALVRQPLHCCLRFRAPPSRGPKPPLSLAWAHTSHPLRGGGWPGTAQDLRTAASCRRWPHIFLLNSSALW